ncbi:Polycystic kidney disease protein 1-like 2 [Stylophora pistillata]|uniref:Polycystic kidney disease protein 1-like 2 n=1 Tax=Stylophora pistillata TaxID=50429 RepID=A0A2B4RLT6_STYPI|nr:Polycystic kidney disease protein 1-like 2 [Stylophora pistillata]
MLPFAIVLKQIFEVVIVSLLDNLLLGCYEEQNNELNLHRQKSTTLSPYKCIETCAHARFPLAVVLNVTECHCANDSFLPMIMKYPCSSPAAARNILLYNTSCLSTASVEIYQGLTFTAFTSKMTPSVSSPVTQSSVTASNSSSKSLLYLIDFGDGKSNKTWREGSILRHHYVTPGEFNIIFVASRGNLTIFILSRKIRVSFVQVNGTWCPPVEPLTYLYCNAYNFYGGGVTAFISLGSLNQTVSLSIPDMVFKKDLETSEFLNGHFFSKIYRAKLNRTSCSRYRGVKSSCGEWVPSSDRCKKVCFDVRHWRYKSIMPCGQRRSNYLKVYSVEANLTAGHNLIVIPKGQWFTADVGDIVGFYRNSSGAELTQITAGKNGSVYFMPARNTFDISVDLSRAQPLELSFDIKLYGSIRVAAAIFVSCLEKVGLYPLITTFANAISSHKVIAFRSLITVQNSVAHVRLLYEEFIKVNTTTNITARVEQGTNVTCEWYIPDSSLTVRQSPYLENNNTTEGGVFQYSSSYSYLGYVYVKVTVTNLVSQKRKSDNIILSVRQSIKGLRASVCHNAFAFENAETCMVSNATQGSEVGCTWEFGPDDYTAREMGKTISHVFTPGGPTNFTLHCYNKISKSSVPHTVQVIPNPLSIDAPLKVPAGVPVKITCLVNWPGGTPALFFEQHGLKGRRGSDIVADPVLTLRASGYSNSSKGNVTMYKSFGRALHRRYRITCKSNSYPDLNIVHSLRAIYSVKGINITSDCALQAEVGTKCKFHVHLLRGDFPVFTWKIRESDNYSTVSKGRKIVHRFVNTGFANITVNASNDVSFRTKTVQFFVYSTHTQSATATESPSRLVYQSSIMSTSTSPLHASDSLSGVISSYSTYSEEAVMSIRPSSVTFYKSASVDRHQIPSLKDIILRHASVGLVGHAIDFSVELVTNPHLVRFIWNWGDRSSLEEAGSTLSHTFYHPGQYFITVNITSTVDHVVLSGHVTVQYRLIDLHIRDLAVTSSNLLVLKFEILQGDNVTYSLKYGDNTEAQVGFLRTLPDFVTVAHQYNERGIYRLSITATSAVGPDISVQRSVYISEIPCVIHELRMLGAGDNSSQCPEIEQENEYSLYSSLKINCSNYGELEYKWKIENILNDALTKVVHLSKEVLSSSALLLESQSLRSGLYKFTLLVTAKPLGLSKSAIGFLRVRMPKLLAVIDCGNKRVMPWNQDIVLNASSSRDPNDFYDSRGKSSLSFEWFCDNNRSVSCFKESIDNRGPALVFPPKYLDLNRTYRFVVVLTKGSRKAEATQSIEVVSGSFLPLCVRCKENCAHKLTPSKELILDGVGCQDDTNTTCIWELYGPPQANGRISKRSIGVQLIRVSYAKQFLLDPRNLISNRIYTILFTNNNSGFSAQYSVITDMSPTNGSCFVSPWEGQVIETQFIISCAGWRDEDMPLQYEFFLGNPEQGPLLLYYGWTPYSNGLFLPPGLNDNDHNVDLFVKISDALGSYRIVPLQAKVRSFGAEADSVSSILKGIVSGPDSMLEKLLEVGEFQQATQLMTTVVTVLNQVSSQEHFSDSTEMGNRVEVRRAVIAELSQVCCSSPQSIQQALGGLLQAIGVTAELSPEALEDGAIALSNMAEALVIKFKSFQAANESRDIIRGLNIILEASVSTSNEVKRQQNSDEIKDWIDDSNEARNKDHQEKCEQATTKSLKGINYAAQKLLDYQRNGDPPNHVSSSLMKMTLTRQSPSDINDAALNGGVVTFKIPEELKKDRLGAFNTVNTKVITMSQTPFISNDATPIDTPVSTLEFLETSGKEIQIQDLAEPVSIFLSLNQTDIKDRNNMTGIIDAKENITIFKIDSDNKSALYLTINCTGVMSGHKLIFTGRRNSKPRTDTFDFRWIIASCNTTLKRLIARKYLNTSERLYLGVKLQTKSNATNITAITSRIRYQVSVMAVGCYYWNEKMQAWTTDGCEVGSLTTPERVECRSNHLTWFGSRVFVPPNKLDLNLIASRISDPSNYAPVLSVLCVTFGLYFLILVWARRQDQKDKNKTGLTLSPSNRPGDEHAYEVVICTGMRRHAGTTANVAMTITGENCESHAFLLRSSHRVTLARGSVDSFLLTTSETLGELLYIRMWHDNFGKDPAWFVKQISIREIDTDGVWYFVCERWLAVDEGDGLIDRIFPVTSNKELNEFRRLFLTKAYNDLTDSHLWFSVVWRPPQSPFTRVQRVSCCLSVLLCTMMANALWYESDTGRYSAVQLGPFEFSWEQVSIGICSSLIVFPINLLLVQIFRHCRPEATRNHGCFKPKPRQRFSSIKTEITMVKFGSREGSALCIHSAGQSQSVNKCSPQEPQKYYEDKGFSLASALRSAHFPALSVSLAMESPPDSTSDIRSLLTRCSPSRQSPTNDSEKSSNAPTAKYAPRAKGLPWWFIYVGWFLVIITSLTAASVTLLYGIQFGLKKSTQWLISMFFSLSQDIFVSQPLKVVAFAVVFVYIFKKPSKVAFSPKSQLKFDEQPLQEQLQDSEEDFGERPEAPPVEVPTEDSIKRARDRAQKERMMHAILLDIGSFLVFTLLVLLIAYGFRDQSAFRQNDAVAKVLLQQSFSGKPRESKPERFTEIIRQRDMWDWMELAMLQTLYNLPSYFYTGKAPTFIEGESGHVVGIARLRQHRTKRDSCRVVPQAQDFFSRCSSQYEMTTEEKQAYATGWDSLSNNTKNSSPSPWRYSSASDLDGYPYTGGIKTYSGGGYVLELSLIYYKALRQIRDSRTALWLDRHTRSMFIEFTLYNPNSNLFCAVTFLMEVFPTGGVFPHSEVLAYRLYRYAGDFQLFILACEVFFLLFVLYFTYREAKKIYKTRRRYFTELWNLMDLAVLMLCWIALSFYFICLGLRKWTLHFYHQNPTKFISFQYLSAWQLMFENVVGVTVFVTCLKFIKLLRFNRRIFLLSCTLRHASKELLQYFIVFIIVFLAFSQLYHFLLASNYESFSTLIGSMQKLLSVLLGQFDLEEMMGLHKILCAVIFFLYTILTNFLFLNLLIAIIIESFEVVKRQND